MSQTILELEIQTDFNTFSPLTPFSLNVSDEFGNDRDREFVVDLVLSESLTEGADNPRIYFTDAEDYVVFDMSLSTTTRTFSLTNAFMVVILVLLICVIVFYTIF